MNLTGRQRVATLTAVGLVGVGLVSGCSGGSPAVVCPAAREIRDLTTTQSSVATIAEVNNVYLLLRQSRPPAEIKDDWQSATDFMKRADEELQALDDPADEVAFTRVWDPLSAELTNSDESVGAAVATIVSYADDHCSATATPTDEGG